MAVLAPGYFSDRMFLYCKYIGDIILMMECLPFYHKLINAYKGRCSFLSVLLFLEVIEISAAPVTLSFLHS